MHQLLQFTATSVLLCLVIAALLLLALLESYCFKKKDAKNDGLREAPTPWKLPLIGHLHLLAGYEVPYQAFTALGRRYGGVVRLQLGSVKCAVVNDQKNIREVLMTKGHDFDARPDFQRYRRLFSGNRENSLAFCDWSETQKNRREMLRAYSFPRAVDPKFTSLGELVAAASARVLRHVDAAATAGRPVDLKPLLLRNCADVFTAHFCSRRFDTEKDVEFLRMVDDFDDIFYEVNQGYAADFLPFLMPLHRNNLERMGRLAGNIRRFVLDRIVGDRFESMDVSAQADKNADYVDSLIRYVKTEDRQKADLPWETALFALEDVLGGHSAVGNFLTKLFGFLVKEEAVQRRIQAEIDLAVGGPDGRQVTICDRTGMPYTEATIFEAVRLIASPIVPRVANQDSSVDGCRVEKGTVLFLNNYDLSMSERLWHEPAKFKPERFVRDGCVFKPDFFLPFGGGRRACMGYKMVQLISFGLLAGIMQRFTVRPLPDGPQDQYKVPIGSLALPKHTFQFAFERR